MDQILDRLYLGSFEDAEVVTYNQCNYVITLNERLPHLTSMDIEHVHAVIPDEVYLPPYTWSEMVSALARALRKHNQTVLVHCRLGVSRSPSVVAAYLTQCGYTLDNALAYVVSCRSCVSPHPETWRGIIDWYKSNQ